MTIAEGAYIDADGHVRDTESKYREYLEAPYNQRVASYYTRGDGFDRSMGGRLGTRKVDAQVWLEMLDCGGVETTVLYPSGGLGIGLVRDRDLAVALARAYNRYMSEEYLKVSPRFKAVALLATQEPEEAARELRHAVQDLGMVGGMLPAHGPHMLGQHQYDPIYHEAERLGVMLAVHATGAHPGGAYEHLIDKFIQLHLYSHSFAQMTQISSVVLEGALERFPKLRMAFLEAGSSWVPYWADRMDEHFELRGAEEAPELKRLPSEYIRGGNVYFSCEAEESLLPEAVRWIGEDQVVYASDFPHWDGTYPESLRHLAGREDLGPAQREKLLRHNAVALYRLG